MLCVYKYTHECVLLQTQTISSFVPSTTKNLSRAFCFPFFFCIMEFVISKRVQYEKVAAERLKEEQVSKELHLESSQTQTLNKKAVLNRIRNHKCIHNLKSLLHTSAANSGSTVDAGYRWIDSGDIFSCP